MSDLITGPLLGRFLRLKTPLVPGQSLLDKALGHAWSEPQIWPRSIRGWCCASLPHSGVLADEQMELAYDDDGHGVWLLWLREEERSASRRAVDTRAAILSSSSGMNFSDMDKREQEELRETAREQLLQRAVPKMRILQLVVTSTWAWIGRRAPDDLYRHMLFPIIGSTYPDVAVWNTDKHGWHGLSLATLQAYLESDDGFLDVDVELVEVRFKGEHIGCQTEGASEEIREAISRLFQVSSAGVTQLSFMVHMHGEQVRVDIDEHGLFRGDPPRSAGGMTHECLKRRFGDLREAAERVGEVMATVYKSRI